MFHEAVYFGFIALEGFDTHRVVGELAQIYLNAAFKEIWVRSATRTIVLNPCKGWISVFVNQETSTSSTRGFDGFCWKKKMWVEGGKCLVSRKKCAENRAF